MHRRSVQRWAKAEFRDFEGGDVRRRARTISLAAAAARMPAGQVTQVVTTAAEAEAAFRWVRNPAVTAAALAKASAAATVRRCAKMPFVFVAVDQTSIGLVDRQRAKGFGHVGRGGTCRKSRGLQVMTALAVDPDGGSLGAIGQAWWARSDAPSPPFRKDRRPAEERESSLWMSCILQGQQAFEAANSSCRPWYQLDRGGDGYHVLTQAHAQGLWLTVRSSYNRRLAGHKQQYLRSCFGRKKRSGFVALTLDKKRAQRLGRSHRRKIQLALSFTHLSLKLTHPVSKRHSECPCYVVRAREHRPPQGVERLEWWLLTTHPVASFDDAKLVLAGYTQRWRVEEFHRTWKSGACKVESSQLRSRQNFQRWATLLAAVAARIERLKYLARNKPDTPALDVLSRDEIDAAILVSKTRKHKPGDDITIAQAVHIIALTGGYTGNTRAGPPGSVTIRRGLERVELVAIGMSLGRNCD